MLAPYYQKQFLEAGTDEAGRGCLAGPVVAAAVILPKNFKHKLLNDSKQITEAQRNDFRKVIEDKAISQAVAMVHHQEIDQINILQASIKAMHLALAQLEPQPEFIIVDGNRFIKYQFTPHQTIVKGDAKYMSIAAASILAKTHRDEYMEQLAEAYPQYLWQQNKGYPTIAHRKAIAQFGPTPFHRMSFRLLAEE
jgi:ribonuclease HII